MNLIASYTKKPVTIEAIQFADDPNTISNIHGFMGAEETRISYEDPTNPVLKIDTLEGTMTAQVGDWIIKGVKAEFYPCKPDIFEATYGKAGDTGEISDGYHTFNELYAHRCTLFLALMKAHPNISWISRKHHDGSEWEGWFIGGIKAPTGDTTYHLPLSAWELAVKTGCAVLETGFPWDGHTSADVIDRLQTWVDLTLPQRGLSFSAALDAAKTGGHRIARAGWNGKGMWVCVGQGSPALEAEKFWNPHTRAFAESNGGKAEVLPYLIFKTADDKILMGWLASQSDLLADDWCILD